MLLAGDSAHQMPPFLGQGMCSGIRDAANLAWKLDLVLRGVAGDALLDSYDDERAPHVGTIIDAAVGFGGLICTTDPEVAAARDKQFLENPAAMSEVGTTFLPTLGPGVLALDDEGRLADGVGRLFLQPWVRRASGEEAMLDDVLGGGFSLLLFDPDGPERGVAALRAMDDDMKSAWMAVGGRSIIVVPAGSKIFGLAVNDGFVEVVEDRDGFLSNWFNDHHAAGVLVRPDRYVFGVTPDVGAAVSLVAEAVNAVGA